LNDLNFQVVPKTFRITVEIFLSVDKKFWLFDLTIENFRLLIVANKNWQPKNFGDPI
jgi:hypothetical protein